MSLYSHSSINCCFKSSWISPSCSSDNWGTRYASETDHQIIKEWWSGVQDQKLSVFKIHLSQLHFKFSITRFCFNSVSHFYLFLIIWLGHKDPAKCQRTRSMIHTSARSESNFKYLVLLALFVFSTDILYVSTTLITLSNVHIRSIFI